MIGASKMIKCPDCRKNSPDGSERCVHCGYSDDPFKKKDTKIIWYKPSRSNSTKSNRSEVVFEKRGGVGDGTTATFPQKDGLRASVLMTCPCCGSQVSNKAKSCPSCGQPIDTAIYCPNCGSPDVKPISRLDKGVSVAMFGAFAANTVISKYRCGKCHFKF